MELDIHAEGERFVRLRNDEPYFGEARVPVSYFWGWIEEGKTIDEFLESFPAVTREQVLQVIHLAAACFAERIKALETFVG